MPTGICRVLAGCVLALLIVGCSAGQGDDGSVRISGYAFAPASVEVPRGLTVDWHNVDPVEHTVTAVTDSETRPRFDVRLPPGGRASMAVEGSGTFSYLCSIHRQMRGEIVTVG